MSKELKALCDLNYCSDSYEKKYPECECKRNIPTICPKDERVQALFARPKEQSLTTALEIAEGVLEQLLFSAKNINGLFAIMLFQKPFTDEDVRLQSGENNDAIIAVEEAIAKIAELKKGV